MNIHMFTVLLFGLTAVTCCSLRSETQSDDPAVHQPNNGVHSDFTLEAGPERLAEALPQEYSNLMQKRFAIVQVSRHCWHTKHVEHVTCSR